MIRRFWNSAVYRTVLVFVMCVFPLNVIAVLNSVRMIRLTEREVQETNQYVAQMTMTALDSLIERMDYWLYDKVNNDLNVVGMFREEEDTHIYQNSVIRAAWGIRAAYQMNPDFDVLFYALDRNGKVIVGTNDASNAYQGAMETFLEENLTLLAPYKWGIYRIEDQKWLVKASPTPGGRYGQMINLSAYEEELKNNSSYETMEVTFQETKSPDEDKEFLCSWASSKFAGIWLGMAIEHRELARGQLSVENGLLIAALFLLLTLPFLLWHVHRTFINPIFVLDKALESYEVDETYRITEKANTNELATSYTTFNNMAERIQMLKIDIMKKELERKRMDLQNLQLQIRPHFLLNTFNMIYFLCESKDYHTIRELILYISEYFRYIYRSGKDTELFGRELKLIHGYIQAVGVRYPGQIHLYCEIDPEIEMVRVPPLLIHNFVENCVSHALIPGKELHIVLCASYDEGIVTFEISDDGCGMSKEIADIINRGEAIKDEARVHVGLMNSVQRIHYFYGEAAVLKVESVLGEGSAFTVEIPYDLEEKDDEATSGE